MLKAGGTGVARHARQPRFWYG